ncbi:MAG: 23S rRNA (adenine(2503)-C(2))-methyltransferase RlmN [Bacillota bacterium]|nr:23S rRNA (adenine(2503)-C(2))-methyltransferase RlmN [Bacillota bacterium]
MINILDLTLEELKNWMKLNGEKEFRAKQIIDWVYKETWEFEKMSNIPKATIDKIKQEFFIGIPEIIEMYKSEDGNTGKYLLKFNDGNIIETVLMKYSYGNSICVSTQVGCRMGCKFCASTLGGVVRNLTSGEIIGEILAVQKSINERISNVVLMGSGEPFDNFENVIKFLELVNCSYGLNIGQRHITVSTCGLVPKIKEFADKKLQVTLAISLHAPNDHMRKELMPIANKYSIQEIMDACKYYINATNKRITFEYALVSGANDNIECAKELAKLLKGMLCHVNLIPVNEIKENVFRKSTAKRIDEFNSILKSYGIESTVRKEMGADINAACGQLRRKYLDEKSGV